MTTRLVVPWYNPTQLAQFCEAWAIKQTDHRFIFQHDVHREGCATTKNKGIQEAAASGATVVIILDDDCLPEDGQTLDQFIEGHEQALEPQPVQIFTAVTDPPSRGTPYLNRTVTMPVAASMGFWSQIGDYDAPSQLVHGATTPMQFHRATIWGRYFPLCGMNLAFRIDQWPWCQFVNVPRFDDIWQGFLWQKKAFHHGECFNLAGPVVKHSRQSNVWANLEVEVRNLERNETIWQDIHRMEFSDYSTMRRKLGIPL